MKRTPLVRKTPLRRSKLRLAVNHAIGAFRSSQHHGDAITYALRGTKATKHARRPRGREFMGWTSRQSCMVCRFFDRLHVAARGNVLMLGLPQHYRCDGRIEVDHAGCRFKQGDGTRAFD